MTYYFKLWYKIMKSLSEEKHFKFEIHTAFTNSILMRFIVRNVNFKEIGELLRKYVNNHIEKYEEYDVHCLLKLLTTTNRVRYIRIKPRSSLQYSFFVPENLFLSKINPERYHFFKYLKSNLLLLDALVIWHMNTISKNWCWWMNLN